ncbi:MAG: hypothetical protein C4534_06070 [Gaiellales bacterium]|nr:MAG: hypothetical protein C4534_06070 [Gaiellales bacterium]
MNKEQETELSEAYLTAGGLRLEVAQFAIEMENEMRANDFKGKDAWKHRSLDSLYNWLLKEVTELHEAMTKARTAREAGRYVDDVISESADGGNILMFIVWKVRNLQNEQGIKRRGGSTE